MFCYYKDLWKLNVHKIWILRINDALMMTIIGPLELRQNSTEILFTTSVFFQLSDVLQSPTWGYTVIYLLWLFCRELTSMSASCWRTSVLLCLGNALCTWAVFALAMWTACNICSVAPLERTNGRTSPSVMISYQ